MSARPEREGREIVDCESPLAFAVSLKDMSFTRLENDMTKIVLCIVVELRLLYVPRQRCRVDSIPVGKCAARVVRYQQADVRGNGSGTTDIEFQSSDEHSEAVATYGSEHEIVH